MIAVKQRKEEFAPVLPYNETMEDHFTIYDHTPYFCNREFCDGKVSMESGNIIKYYACHDEEQPVTIRSSHETGEGEDT